MLYADARVEDVIFRLSIACGGTGSARGVAVPDLGVSDSAKASKLGLAIGEGRGDDGRGASGGSRNVRARRSVVWLALWLSAELLFRLCEDDDELGELSTTDCRRDSRPAMYADERSVAGAVIAGWGRSGRSAESYMVAISRMRSISTDETDPLVEPRTRRSTESGFVASELSGVTARRPPQYGEVPGMGCVAGSNSD